MRYTIELRNTKTGETVERIAAVYDDERDAHMDADNPTDDGFEYVVVPYSGPVVSLAKMNDDRTYEMVMI